MACVQDPIVPLSNRQRAAANAVGIMACQGVSLVLQLLILPFLLHKLGKEDYGGFQFTRTFIQYLPLLTLAAGPAIARYVTHALGREDYESANRYMNTGLIAMLATGGVMLLAGIGTALLIPSVFRHLGPAQRPAQILLVFLTATAATSYISQIFAAPLVAREKLAETQGITLVSEILRALGMVLAFTFFSPRLIWIGVASLAGALVSNQIAMFAAYRVAPWLKISIREIDMQAFKSLASFSAISTIGVLVQALYYGSANLIIEWLYGTTGGLAMITIYTMGSQWDGWIRGVVAPLTRIINPRMTILSAQDRGNEMRRLIAMAIRYATCLVAPICVFVSIFGAPILTIWVGRTLSASDIATSARLIPIFLIPLIVAIGTSPAQAVYIAHAKIGVPSFVMLVGAVLNILLGVFLCRVAGWGLAGLATGTGSTLAAAAVFFTPYYLKRLTGLTYTEFYLGALARPIALALAFFGLCIFVRHAFFPRTLIHLAIDFVLCGVAYAIGTYLVVLLPHDRESVLSAARSVLRRVRRQPA